MNLEEEREKAVAYVRMSTDHQKYSIGNQLDVIEDYANRNNFEITEVFSDEGKSGVQLKGRDSAIRLFDRIKNGEAAFKHLLVYDVSRWGRFQNPDEAAHHEYECNQGGICVHYCAEGFTNDGTMGSFFNKSAKRIMAGEYSRELSSKVFRGQCNLIRRGFRQGGTVGYGLRRMLINDKGEHKEILTRGAYKAIQTDRVIQVLGPDEEVETVRWIYNAFVHKLKTEREIARLLNQKGIKTDLDRDWSAASVLQILTNEKYMGNNVFNKTSGKLIDFLPFEPRRITRNAKEKWIRAEGVFPAIIDSMTFQIVQEMINERTKKFSNETLLEKLKKLYLSRGSVSGIIIDENDDMPSSAVYSHRFGGLLRAYELIGYTPQIDYSYIQINRYLRRLHADILLEIESCFVKQGILVERMEANNDDIRLINREIRMSLNVSRCRRMESGKIRWHLRLEHDPDIDFSIIARMESNNLKIKDYYLITRFDRDFIDSRIHEENGFFMEAFRYDSLDWLYEIFTRTNITKLTL